MKEINNSYVMRFKIKWGGDLVEFNQLAVTLAKAGNNVEFLNRVEFVVLDLTEDESYQLYDEESNAYKSSLKIVRELWAFDSNDKEWLKYAKNPFKIDLNKSNDLAILINLAFKKVDVKDCNAFVAEGLWIECPKEGMHMRLTRADGSLAFDDDLLDTEETISKIDDYCHLAIRNDTDENTNNNFYFFVKELLKDFNTSDDFRVKLLNDSFAHIGVLENDLKDVMKILTENDLYCKVF